MAIREYKPQWLTDAEQENDPSIIGSIGAGIATGLIRIPEGAASLFASLYDLQCFQILQRLQRKLLRRHHRLLRRLQT